MFKEYSPMQYLAIDIANQYGLDKQEFETRIQWVKDNLDTLENLQDTAEEPMLYWKAVRALRKALKGIPINHTVALDSASSGLQLMSVLTGCKTGAEYTGLINPNKRSDAYTELTVALNDLLSKEGVADVTVTRKQAKEAIMTYLYGSKAVPERVFGEDIVPYFEQVMQEKCVGATALLHCLLDSVDKSATEITWTLPDGYYVKTPCMEVVEKRIKIEELNYCPVVAISLNQPVERNISIAANAIHSVDAYVLRSLIRRCNYNPNKLHRFLSLAKTHERDIVDKSLWFVDKYLKTNIADIYYINFIDETNIHNVPIKLIDGLIKVCNMVLKHPPFEVITIHDSFACHANHCNTLRFHYKEILAELAESTLCKDLLEQLYGEEFENPQIENIADYIRNSNYGIS